MYIIYVKANVAHSFFTKYSSQFHKTPHVAKNPLTNLSNDIIIKLSQKQFIERYLYWRNICDLSSRSTFSFGRRHLLRSRMVWEKQRAQTQWRCSNDCRGNYCCYRSCWQDLHCLKVYVVKVKYDTGRKTKSMEFCSEHERYWWCKTFSRDEENDCAVNPGRNFHWGHQE